MNRAEIITWVKGLIDGYKQTIEMWVQEGSFEKDEYSWQEMLDMYTGVEVETLDEIESLTDGELKKIVDEYI